MAAQHRRGRHSSPAARPRTAHSSSVPKACAHRQPIDPSGRRLLFSSDSTAATTSSWRSPATAFAGPVKPPTKTPRLVKSACSSVPAGRSSIRSRFRASGAARPASARLRLQMSSRPSRRSRSLAARTAILAAGNSARVEARPGVRSPPRPRPRSARKARSPVVRRAREPRRAVPRRCAQDGRRRQAGRLGARADGVDPLVGDVEAARGS